MSGMRGILYKTIVGRQDSAQAVRKVKSALDTCAETEGVTPVDYWAGASVTEGFLSQIRPERCRGLLVSGVVDYLSAAKSGEG